MSTVRNLIYHVGAVLVFLNIGIELGISSRGSFKVGILLMTIALAHLYVQWLTYSVGNPVRRLKNWVKEARA